MLVVKPRAGEYILRDNDIIETIKTHGKEIAVILFSGLSYFTGQLFDMAAITRAGHEQVLGMVVLIKGMHCGVRFGSCSWKRPFKIA